MPLSLSSSISHLLSLSLSLSLSLMVVVFFFWRGSGDNVAWCGSSGVAWCGPVVGPVMGFEIRLLWVVNGWSVVDGFVEGFGYGLFVGLAWFQVNWVLGLVGCHGFEFEWAVGFAGLGLLSCAWSVGCCGSWWVVFGRSGSCLVMVRLSSACFLFLVSHFLLSWAR